MPAKILVISKNQLFIDSVDRALHNFDEVPHIYHRKETFDDDLGYLDLMIIGDLKDFELAVAHLEKVLLTEVGDPTVVFAAPAPVIVSVINKNLCTPVTIRYLTMETLVDNDFFLCITSSISHTRDRNALRSDQDHYLSLFEQSIDPSFILNNTWCFTKVNSAFAHFLNKSKKDIFGRAFKDLLVDPIDFQSLKEEVRKAPNKLITKVLRLAVNRRKKGVLVRLKLTANTNARSTMGIEGFRDELVGYNVTFTDITEQKALEVMRNRIETMDNTYRLARSIAHEIRNPLTNVVLAMDQVKDELSENEDSKLYFAIIDRSVKRIEVLLSELLKGAQRRELTLVEQDVVALLKEVILENMDRFKLRNINVQRNFEEETYFIPIDEAQMKLAFSNLITNGIEAIETEEEGCITVGCCIEDGAFYLFVEDNGVGIEPDVVNKLFAPFFTSKKKGVGFGLTATQSIIVEHGAEIHVESSLGKGACFSIAFPLVDQSNHKD